MAGDANSISLFNWAAESNDPMVMAVTDSIYQSGNVLQDIPVMTDASLIQKGVRMIGGYPVPTWTDLNAGPTSFNAQPQPYTENCYTTRDNIDCDRLQVKDKNQIGGAGAMRARRLKWYLTGYAFEFNYRFFNSRQYDDGTTRYNPRCFTGIRERIDNSDYKVNSEMKINASNLDMSPTGMTKATANRMLELITQLCDYTGAGQDGDGVVLYASDFFWRRFEFALRLLEVAGFGFDKDVYERKVTTWRNAKLRDPGRLAPAQDGTQTGRVITTSEKTDGTDGVVGTDVCTSVYAVRYGDDLFHAWHFEMLKAMDLGVINDGVTYRSVFDYTLGLWMEHTRSLGRIYGIKMA
jgi:hypothetical protein